MNRARCSAPILGIAGVLLAAVAGCSSEGAAPEPGATPTFTRDVAPIVFTHCAPCHRPGEPTPFTLLSYDDVRRKAKQIARVTARRLMPPWLPLPGHIPLVGARRLTDAHIDTLRRWVEAGTPEGDARDLPPLPTWPRGWQLREPDLVVTLPEPFALPAKGPDVFRNFVVPVQVASRRFVAAVEIRPGSRAVHHAILQVDRTLGSRRRDAQDEGPGFAGMSMASSEPPDGHFLGWTAGKRVLPAPPGMAWRLFPGSDLVLQLHLTPTGKPEQVAPRIGLFFTDEPPRSMPQPIVLFSEAIDIPPGDAEYRVRDAFTLPAPVRVFGVYPHAHYLCRSMRGFVRLPDGAQRTMFEIAAWDFDWQDDYRFVAPLDLPAGAVIEFEYRFDNSSANPGNPSDPPRRVRFGQESRDEMATLTVMAVPRDAAGRRAVRAEGWRATLRKKPWDYHAHLQLARVLHEGGDIAAAMVELQNALRLRPDYTDALSEAAACALRQGRTDAARRALERVLAGEPDHGHALLWLGRACLQQRDAAGARRAFEHLLRVRPDDVEGHNELGMLLARNGSPAAAVHHFERVLAFRPELAEARNNLATALLEQRILPRAIDEFRRALALRPDYFHARFNLARALLAAGEVRQGREELAKAAALRPEDPAVRAEQARWR
ncbi:MAG: tetratricopeptide repeat protein [Planctomycetes bacterium]|nr:tetratricopeptide repeat protein [Planctomycetota bacterium]MCB9889477.1 tetratricopeptide repeat protein [Planctomycetota bacterium]